MTTTQDEQATFGVEDSDLSDNPSLDLESKRRRRFTRSTTAILLILALALAGWTAFGITLAISTQANAEKTERLSAIESQLQSLQSIHKTLGSQLKTVTDERDEYRDASQEVVLRDIEVGKKEAAVKEREDAVTATESHIKETTLLDGNTYTVGTTMEAGTYQATASGSRCYWSITRSGSNYSDIIDNDLGSAGVLTVSVASGQDFKSSRCGNWTKVG